ncbi:MAG: protein-glutamate O-methyltransferase CheR [Halioglobus sp.]
MSAALKKNKTAPLVEGRPFEFTDADFKRVCELVRKNTGIALSDHKRDLVYGRLAKRLRVHKLDCFSAYCSLVENNPEAELESFTNAITTNLTAFFREDHHFKHLENTVLPTLVSGHNRNKRIRIWSAGCSTGEEPYSLAISLRERIPDIDSRDIQILATDLDSNVIRTASAGIYTQERIEGLDEERQKRWFRKGKGANAGKVQVSPELAKLITFRQLNLMNTWPMKGVFDIVFCRNVVIYFDKETQKVLFDRFANAMPPNSNLFIGHSETLHNVCERFELIGKTIYRKTR